MTKTIKVGTPTECTHFLYNVWCMRCEHPLALADVEEIMSHFLTLAAQEREGGSVDQSNNYIRLAEVVTNLYHLGKCASRKFQKAYRIE